MITKKQLLDACRHETNVIKHIATRLPEGSMDWRPTEGQRSMIELMRYLTVGSQIMAVNCVTGDWEHAPALNAESEQVTPESFADAMDRQLSRVEEVVADLDEAVATTKPVELPWKEPTTQSELMLRGLYASYVAYRMQFFLYAKQAGNADLTTMDCWVGGAPPG